jgi:hypothetical protein
VSSNLTASAIPHFLCVPNFFGIRPRTPPQGRYPAKPASNRIELIVTHQLIYLVLGQSLISCRHNNTKCQISRSMKCTKFTFLANIIVI